MIKTQLYAGKKGLLRLYWGLWVQEEMRWVAAMTISHHRKWNEYNNRSADQSVQLTSQSNHRLAPAGISTHCAHRTVEPFKTQQVRLADEMRMKPIWSWLTLKIIDWSNCVGLETISWSKQGNNRLDVLILWFQELNKQESFQCIEIKPRKKKQTCAFRIPSTSVSK